MRAIKADELRRAIFARGMTQKAFAQAAGVQRQTITYALSGRPVRPSTLRCIVKALTKLDPITEDLA